MIVIVLYFLLFLAVSVTSRFMANREVRRYYQLFLCFILLFVFFGFRDITVLNDTSHYYGFYYQKARYISYLNQSAFAYNLTDRFEYGFQVVVHLLIKYVSKDPYTIIWTSSLVLTFGELWFVSKYTDNIAYMLFFMLIGGLIFTHYCIIRQAFALIIFYIAFGYLEKDRTFIFCLLVILASLFHFSAIVLLVLPVLKRLEINRRNILILLGITVVVGLLIIQILTILGFTNSVYFKKTMEKETSSIAGIFDCLLMVFTIGSCAYIHLKMKLQNINKTFFWTCMYALCIGLITPTFFILNRINVYLWPIIMIQLLKYITPDYQFAEQDYQQQTQLRRLAQLTFVVVFVSKMAVLMIFRPEWSHVIPYQFYDFSDHYHYYNMYEF